MVERFIGIENELTTFRGGRLSSFTNYFNELRNSFDTSANHDISRTAIRTGNGTGYYVDGNEIEILTPPIALNKGFSTRLTDMLILGRNKVIETTPGLEHTGYSMHWNLTLDENLSRKDFYEGIAIPFQLFGLTPLSYGFNVREKDNRYEILGDSLCNEDQINATALLLGASLYAMSEFGGTPFKLPEHSFLEGSSKKLFLHDGRYEKIKAKVGRISYSKELQAQQFLEVFYDWIKPYVEVLGEDEEIKNLEDFINMEKKLEFDMFKYFSYLNDERGKENGVYMPISTDSDQNPSQVLNKSEVEKEIPLEGKLLGTLVKNNRHIRSLGWESVIYDGNEINGIGNIYKFSKTLDDALPDFIPSYESEEKLLQPINKFKSKKLIHYDPDKDEFEDDRELIKTQDKGISFTRYFLDNVDFRALALGTTFISAIGLGISSGLTSCAENFYVDHRVDSIIEDNSSENDLEGGNE